MPGPAPEWLAGRGIRQETLDACRPLIRRDSGGRLLFAHRDRNRRITGFEIGPPDGARRFATGGTRSLFALRAARTLPNVRTVVLAQDGDETEERQMSRSRGGAHQGTPTGTTSSTPPRRDDGPDRRPESGRPDRFPPASNTLEHRDHSRDKA